MPGGKGRTLTNGGSSSRTRNLGKATAKRNGASATSAAKAADGKQGAPFRVRRDLPPRAARAVKQAAEALWDAGLTPHSLLAELKDVLLLRCLDEAEGNFAAAASIFGPSRQSVQQYANSALRDARWHMYQNSRRTHELDEP